MVDHEMPQNHLTVFDKFCLWGRVLRFGRETKRNACHKKKTKLIESKVEGKTVIDQFSLWWRVVSFFPKNEI